VFVIAIIISAAFSGCIGREDDDYVRGKAVTALKKITGKDFGYDQEKWQQWWEENK